MRPDSEAINSLCLHLKTVIKIMPKLPESTFI